MKWIAPFTSVLITVAACITIIFVKALKPTSNGAFLFFAVWLVLPYAIMGAVIISLRRRGAASIRWHIVAVMVSFIGILFMADVIFWRPDAQGAIAVLMTPILQGGASAVLVPIALWVSQKVRA